MDEALILAGGFGTRLQSVISDVPKPLAPVAGRPMLEYLLLQLHRCGVKHVVLSLGFKYQLIRHQFGPEYKGIELSYSVEATPLGTGGAIATALSLMSAPHFMVLNGDSIFMADLEKMYLAHATKQADITMGLRAMQDASRYGTVQMGHDEHITGFSEKTLGSSGLINAGVYVFRHAFLNALNFSGKFSLEKDVFEALSGHAKFYGYQEQAYFIDIGIPDDYRKAQKDLPKFFI